MLHWIYAFMHLNFIVYNNYLSDSECYNCLQYDLFIIVDEFFVND
jgi:hypothetical protein